jgi:hypothetical protein
LEQFDYILEKFPKKKIEEIKILEEQKDEAEVHHDDNKIENNLIEENVEKLNICEGNEKEAVSVILYFIIFFKNLQQEIKDDYENEQSIEKDVNDQNEENTKNAEENISPQEENIQPAEEINEEEIRQRLEELNTQLEKYINVRKKIIIIKFF